RSPLSPTGREQRDVTGCSYTECLTAAGMTNVIDDVLKPVQGCCRGDRCWEVLPWRQ
ncbi:hypothetical protein IRJ41_007919, partial [Triplophysa rosa]